MSGLFGFRRKYRVDYCGDKAFFRNARNSYAAGKKVRLVYFLTATDTSYRFCLDGEELRVDWSEREGYIITFTMPEHDVRLCVESNNTMEYCPGDGE